MGRSYIWIPQSSLSPRCVIHISRSQRVPFVCRSPQRLTFHDLHGQVFLLPCSPFPASHSCWSPLSTMLSQGGCLLSLHKITSISASSPLTKRLSQKQTLLSFLFVSCLQIIIKTLIKALFHRNQHCLHSHRVKTLSILIPQIKKNATHLSAQDTLPNQNTSHLPSSSW